jgi:glutathione S-transferase
MPTDGANRPPFLLYGAERSYFTGKARPALRAKRVYFEEILPTPAAYREILRRTGMAFIPIVVTPENDTWQDTSEIIDALEARFPEPALIPATPVQRLVAYLFELYADEFLILPAMHYRWSTPEGERDARSSFAALSGDPASAEKFAGRMAGSLTALGVDDASIPAIVEHLGDLLDALEAVLGEQSFLLGEQPSLADCAMMGPLYAHLYLDRIPGPLLRERAPRVSHWIERSNHPDPGAFEGFLAADALHPGMRAVLELIGGDAVPLLLDSLRAFEEWADARPGESNEPPRAVGFHRSALRGIAVSRYTSAYTPWMIQRCLDAYEELAESQREEVARALVGTGCEALFGYQPRHRLAKRSFKLVFEERTGS